MTNSKGPGIFRTNNEAARVALEWFGIVIICTFLLAIGCWILYLIWPAILTMAVVIGTLLLIARPWRSDHPDL